MTPTEKEKKLRETAVAWIKAYDPASTHLSPKEERLLTEVTLGNQLRPMSGRILKNGLDEANATPAPNQTVRASLIRWLCSDKDAQALMRPEGVVLEDATIVGEGLSFITDRNDDQKKHTGLNLSSLKIPFPLVLHHCTLPQWLLMLGTEIPFLDLDGCTIDSIRADVLSVRGDLYMRCVRHFPGGGVIKLLGATIGGDLDFGGSRFRYGGAGELSAYPGEKTRVISAEGIKVQGDIHFNGWPYDEGGTSKTDHFSAEGGISLDEATVGSDLNCKGAKLFLFQPGSTNETRQNASDDDSALSMRGAFVKGHIYFSDVQAIGSVRLPGTEVGQSVDCTAGHFCNPWMKDVVSSGIALELDGAKIAMDFAFSKKSGAEAKETSTSGAQTNDAEACTSALKQFPPCRQQSTAGGKSATACGTVSLVGTKIGRTFDCRFGRFQNATPSGDGQESSWRPALDLTGARAGELRYPLCFKGDFLAPGQLALDGFVYDRVDGMMNRKDCLKWIALQDDKGSLTERAKRWLLTIVQRLLNRTPKASFKAQPYLQLAKSLREIGKNRDARKVLFAMECHRPRHPLAKLLTWLPRITIGHGYLPGRALCWMGLLILLGWLVYAQADASRSIIPTDSKKYIAQEYSSFQPLLFSIENSQPFVKFGQSDRWQLRPQASCSLPCLTRSLCLISAQQCCSPTLDTFRAAQIVIGWILMTMGVFGLTGLVRKD